VRFHRKYPDVTGRHNGPKSAYRAAVLVLVIFTLMALPECKPPLEKAKSFKAVFDNYRDREHVIAISFPPGMVGIFLDDEEPGQAELKELFRELSAFRMLSLEGGQHNSTLAEELGMDINEFTAGNGFQDLVRIRSAGEEVNIMIQETDGIIREAIISMDTDEDFIVIGLRGNISADLFARLVEGGYIQELTGLSGIDLW
jgi:hypothetical protein